jgi:hypothetical protein
MHLPCCLFHNVCSLEQSVLDVPAGILYQMLNQITSSEKRAVYSSNHSSSEENQSKNWRVHPVVVLPSFLE